MARFKREISTDKMTKLSAEDLEGVTGGWTDAYFTGADDFVVYHGCGECGYREDLVYGNRNIECANEGIYICPKCGEEEEWGYRSGHGRLVIW